MGARVIAIGECMVELSLTGARDAALGYAGDVFNTAIYLRRLGIDVSFATTLGGQDPFSEAIARRLAEEGVGADLVSRAPGRLPGLYAIERDETGERRFFYWRDQAPFRQFFGFADLDRFVKALNAAGLIYLSGVTLAVLGEDGHARLLDLVAKATRQGARVALDPNYRARLWASPEAARASLESFAPYCAILSVSAPDIATLYDAPLGEVAARWAAHGAEVVARADDLGVEVHAGGEVLRLAPGAKVTALDTTGAGDSFNAGYLASRLSLQPPEVAVVAGRRVSTAVVQRIGAIIPLEDMPAPVLA